MDANGHTIKEHFENRAPEVKATYAAILKAAKKLGPVKETEYQPAVAGDSIKPGVERSGTPGCESRDNASPRSGRQSLP